MNVKTEISPGTLVDNRYLVDHVLGQGGFGRTYLAFNQRRFNEPCVLKEFVPSGSDGYIVHKSRELFQREAEVLHQLDRAEIPKFYEWFEEDGRLFLVQQFIDGKNYYQLTMERKEAGNLFSEQEVIQWLKDLLPVLQYLHERNILHRDISPDNIMLPNNSNKPVLIDFGVVRQVMTQVHHSDLTNSQQGSIVGKVGYSPTEQIRMGQCYPNSDLYALAVSALVLMTGMNPDQLYNGYSLTWQWDKYLKISNKLNQILTKMLAEKANERYQSAREVLAALNHISSQENNALLERTKLSSLPTQPSLQSEKNKTIKAVNHRDFSQEAQQKNNLPIALGGIAVLLIAGGVLVTQIPKIDFLCSTFNNCLTDSEYQEAIAIGKDAISSGKQAKNIEELQTSKNNLNRAIGILERIPNNSSNYQNAQTNLTEYREQLQQIEAKINNENNHATALKSIEDRIEQLKQEKPSTLDDYEKTKEKWNKLAEEIKKIPNDVAIAENVKIRTSEIESKIQATQAQIDLLLTQQQPTNTTNMDTGGQQPTNNTNMNTGEQPQTNPSYSPPPGEPLW
jgi:serine/threonine-protein kinase